MDTIVHAVATNEVDQRHGRGFVSYFRISFNTRSFNISVDAGVFDADGTTESSGACWNQSNGLTLSFFVGGKIQWNLFLYTYEVSRTMGDHGSTCTNPWPMWPIQKVTHLTHWFMTRRPIACYGPDPTRLVFLPLCMKCRRGLAMRILSVCPSVCSSVCQTRDPWQNGRKIGPDFYTLRKNI